MSGLNTAPSLPRIWASAPFSMEGNVMPGLNTAPSLPLFCGLKNRLQMTSYYIGPHQPASKGKISITLWPQKPPQPRFWAINYNLDFFASSI